MQPGVPSAKIQRQGTSGTFQKEAQCDHRRRNQGREWHEMSMQEPNQERHLNFILNVRKIMDASICIKPAYALGQGSLSKALLCSVGLSQEWDSKVWFINSDYKYALIFQICANTVIIIKHTSCVFNDRCSDYRVKVLQR